MQWAIGVDLVEISRVRQLCERWGERFEQRIFTPRELAYVAQRPSRVQSLAARFAAKEAVFKALGSGWSFGMRWRDIEVRNDPHGKPEVHLSGTVQAYALRRGVRQILVSLSHTSQYAVAFVQMELADGDGPDLEK